MIAPRTPRRLAALLVLAALAQPALAMDVTIGEVTTSVRDTDAGGSSFLGPLVKIVKAAIEDKAQQQQRRDAEQRPQRPA